MPVTVNERAESRLVRVGSQTKSLTRMFVLFHTTSEDEAYAALLANTQPFVGNLTRTDARVKSLGGTVWDGEAEYTNADPASAVMPDGQPPPAVGPSGGESGQAQVPAPGDALGPQYTIDTSAQQVHITQSLETVAEDFAAPLPGNPDYKRAIAVDKDTVHGCDIYAPKQEWTVQVTRQRVTFDYVQAVGNLAGRTNRAAFYNYPVGSILSLGATFQCGPELRWTVTHKFLYAPNQVNLDVGNGLTLTRKRGHEFVWVGYKDGVSNEHGILIPVFAKTERVYEEGNFALLEIGQ